MSEVLKEFVREITILGETRIEQYEDRIKVYAPKITIISPKGDSR